MQQSLTKILDLHPTKLYKLARLKIITEICIYHKLLHFYLYVLSKIPTCNPSFKGKFINMVITWLATSDDWQFYFSTTWTRHDNNFLLEFKQRRHCAVWYISHLGKNTRICRGSLRTVKPSAPRNIYFLISHSKNNHVGWRKGGGRLVKMMYLSLTTFQCSYASLIFFLATSPLWPPFVSCPISHSLLTSELLLVCF